MKYFFLIFLFLSSCATHTGYYEGCYDGIRTSHLQGDITTQADWNRLNSYAKEECLFLEKIRNEDKHIAFPPSSHE